MGSVVFNDSYWVTGIGQSQQNVRINYSESYNASTNKTTVTFTSAEIASNFTLGNCVIRGKVQFNNIDVKTYPTTTSSYTASIGGGVTNYSTITGGSGGSIIVSHNSSGIASFTIKLVSLEGSYFGAAYNGNMFGISNGSSKTVSLTTHTSTLTVNPNGGVWNNSSSSQNFVQAPTSTKSIGNPSRTGYIFNGWSLSGGGSWNGSIYTYGGSNGTLTANWIIATYTVTCEDRIGNSSGTLLGSTTNTYNYNSTASGADFGSSAVYNTYYTGYYYIGSTSSIVTQAVTVYRFFDVNSYTLSITTSAAGVTTDINRTESPMKGATIGSITNGALIYYNDKISINYTLGGAYQLLTATVNSVDISSEILPYSVTVNQNIVISITAKLGAIVYIRNEAYQAFIGDGTNWNQYQAYIGNGTSFDQY